MTTNDPKSKRRHLKRLSISIVSLVLLLALTAGWLVFRSQQVEHNLRTAMTLAYEMQDQLASGNAVGARATLQPLRSSTSQAREAAQDPLWRAAGAVPLIGPNFSAVSELAVSIDDVVNHALSLLLDDSGSMEWAELAPRNGKIDTDAIRDAAPGITAAASTVQLSHERLVAIDESQLLPQIAEPLEEAEQALAKAGEALGKASSVAQVLPNMLGSDTSRNYLILIQNNAEVRATGGIPGALAVIRADGGRLDLIAQGSATEMGRFDPAIISDAEQAQIYSSRMGRFMQSTNLTPDFPTAAETAATMWEVRNEGTEIDGVVALDPIVLAKILQGVGPLNLSFEDANISDLISGSGLPTSLTAGNVLPTLLSDVYSAIEEPKLQDAYFGAVAAEIFDAFSAGSGDSRELIQAIAGSADEGRIYVWSAVSEEQETIAETGLAGKVTGPTTGGATFGAYFNDGTGAKMDYYVERTVQLRYSCTPDGYMQYTLVATLTNTAPENAAQSLPASVTGGGSFGVPPGTVQTNFVGYGPDRSHLQTARLNGQSVPLGSYRHDDRPVGMLTTSLQPGQTATVELDFTDVVQRSEPSLDVTPTIQPMSEVLLPIDGDGTCS